MSRKGFRCFECDEAAHHAHHVIPVSLGGTKTIPLCHDCHGKVHEQDYTNHSELTKKGIERARAEGKDLGRPSIEIDWKLVDELRDKGLFWHEIAKRLKVNENTLRNHRQRKKLDEVLNANS